MELDRIDNGNGPVDTIRWATPEWFVVALEVLKEHVTFKGV
jgi:hypothetical protein